MEVACPHPSNGAHPAAGRHTSEPPGVRERENGGGNGGRARPGGSRVDGGVAGLGVGGPECFLSSSFALFTTEFLESYEEGEASGRRNEGTSADAAWKSRKGFQYHVR